MRFRDWWTNLLGLALVLTACGKSESADGGSGRGHRSLSPLGAPCLGADESRNDGFHNYAENEVVIQERDLQCDSALCLINHFQGRVSCPYGQTEAESMTSPRCFVPATDDPVTVEVEPQLLARPADDAVICSCRCAGPVGPFCACPAGMVCDTVVKEIGTPPPDGGVMAASYCIPEGTSYDPAHPSPPDVCDETLANCGDPRPFPPP